MATDTLTRDEIVTAAIDLLDREGLEGLNMRALGKRLRSAATAVYWHVGSKEDLVALAGDQVWHEVALPDLTRIGWRAAASAMANNLRAMLGRHPWLMQVFGSFVVYGPGKARFDDHSFALYESAGFTPRVAEQVATAVLTLVLGHALGEAADAALARKLSRQGRKAEKALRDRIARAREIAVQFPRLRAHLETSVAPEYAVGLEHSFELGLEAMLDGLDAQLTGARPTRKVAGRGSRQSRVRARARS
jgi:AcrR family transcriptional regulator